MAKSSPQEQKSELEFLQKQKAAYEDAQKVIQQYNRANQQTKIELEGQLLASRKIIQSFIQQFKSLKDFNNLLDKTGTSYAKVIDKADDFANTQDTIFDSFKELDKELVSIGNTMDKNTKSYSIIEDRVKTIKSVTEDISKELQSGAVANDDTRDAVQETAQSYVQMNASVIGIIRQRKKGKITEDQLISQLNEQADSFKEMYDTIDFTQIKSKELIELLKSMNVEASKFSKLMQTSGDKEIISEGRSAAASIGQSAAGNLPGGSDVVDALATGSIAAAMFKLIQAAGKGVLAIANVAVTAVERQGEAIQKDLDLLMQFNENVARMAGNIPSLKAAFEFDTDLMKMNAEFNAASKTAFLGSGLGSIKYGGAQLQLAGISAEQLVSTMNEMSSAGNSASKDLAVNTAIFARKTGIASGDMSQLVGQFRMLDKSGATTAFTTIEKSLSNAGKEGYNVADIANELKDAGGLALEYNIKSSQQLVKQVKSVREMGGSWAKISEAGKNMVLNYKDSIRKEMELSAMLGENVDLSEARALFAAGRGDEAFAVLKSSGILQKAQSQGLFGTQALSAALGGMDLTQLAAGGFEKGPSKGIVSNQAFLDTLQAALKNLKIDVANTEITRTNQQLMQIDRLENALIYSSGTLLGLAARKKTEEISTQLDITEAQTKALTNISSGPAGIADELIKGAALQSNVPGQIGFNLNEKLLAQSLNLPYIGLSPLKQTPATSTKVMQNAGQYSLPTTTYQPTVGTAGGSAIAGGMSVGIDNSNTRKSIDGQSSTLVKILDRNHKSMVHLEQINASTNTMVNLTKDIRALTAVMSGLSTDSVMKLVLDGKELKTRIEKIQTQEKGKTKS